MASLKAEKPVGTQPSAPAKKASAKAPPASKSAQKKPREPKKKVN